MPYVTSIERMAKEEGWAKGLEKGRKQGRKQGREEGRAEMVVRLMRRRWEPLPAGLEAQVRALSVEQLENLAEAHFEFKSLSEVETWLSAHASRG